LGGGDTKGPGVSGNLYSDGKKTTGIIDRYGGPDSGKPLMRIRIRKRSRGTRRRIYKRNERKQVKNKEGIKSENGMIN
jgi:hypothetical protein